METGMNNRYTRKLIAAAVVGGMLGMSERAQAGALLSDAVALWNFTDIAVDGGTSGDANGANSLLTLIGGTATNGPSPRIFSGNTSPSFWDNGGQGDGPGSDGFFGSISLSDPNNADHRRDVYFDAGQGAGDELKHTGAHTFMIRTDIKDASVTGYLFNKFDHKTGPTGTKNYSSFLRYEPGGNVRYVVNEGNGLGTGANFEVFLTGAIPATSPRLVDFYSVFDPDSDKISVYMLDPKTRAILAQGTTTGVTFDTIGDSLLGTGMAGPVPFTIGDRLTFDGLSAFQSVGLSRADMDIETAAFWDRAYSLNDLINLLPSVVEWTKDGNGQWNNDNWSTSPAVPANASDTAVLFGSANSSGPVTVTINDTRTLGYIEFDSANSYTLAGSGSGNIVMTTTAQRGRIEATSGSHAIDVAINFQNAADITGSANLSFGGVVAVLNSTNVQFDDGSGTLNLSNTGSLKGNGTVDGSVDSDGLTIPGDALAVDLLTVTGDFSQSVSGNIWMDIESLVSFDELSITGNMTQGGTLTVSLLGGFTPAENDSFDLFDAASFSGGFSSFSLPNLSGAGLDWDTSSLLTTGELKVVIAGTLEGDLDGDGFVGISDLNLVLGNWNQNVPPGNQDADPSGDGFVGIEDLNTVLGNWNAGTPPTHAVPEPASLAFVVIGVALASNRRRLR